MTKNPYRLTWLPDVLRKAGLKVIEVPGWQWRGHGDIKQPKGVLLHHTADGLTGNYPSLHLVTTGRSDLAGPLAQLGLGRDGTYYVIAAGKAYHAGSGNWPGIGNNNGNSYLIGIEAENSGYTQGIRAEAWSKVQMDAYKKGVLALLNYLHVPVTMAIGHKEYAPKRKIDPTFDMNKFRADLKELNDGRQSSS